MIRIPVTTAGLAGMRFAVSPLFEAASTLYLLRNPNPPPSARKRAARAQAALVRHKLTLLLGLVQARGAYTPDFLTPEPHSFDGDLGEELHRVATTPPERVGREMAAMVAGRVSAGMSGAPPPRAVLAALDRGETVLTQRLADELDAFWHDEVAPRWSGLRRSLEDDVDRRAQVMTRQGIGALWSTLGPRTDWRDGVLSIVSPYTVDVTWGETVILVPSAIAQALGTGVDPCGERTTFLQYPVGPSPSGSDAGDERDAVAQVIGHTRTALLASLKSPRGTAELATMHHLAPATVSYHLTRLHRGGLATRVRRGRTVLYRRTARADALLCGAHLPEC